METINLNNTVQIEYMNMFRKDWFNPCRHDCQCVLKAISGVTELTFCSWCHENHLHFPSSSFSSSESHNTAWSNRLYDPGGPLLSFSKHSSFTFDLPHSSCGSEEGDEKDKRME